MCHITRLIIELLYELIKETNSNNRNRDCLSAFKSIKKRKEKIMINLIYDNHLLNTTGLEILTYYNTKTKEFVILDSFELEEYDENDLLVTPYFDEATVYADRIFYNSITENEREIIKNRPWDIQFFDYLKEIGLYYTYEEAKKQSIVYYFKKWCFTYHIPFTKASLTVY